MRAGGELLPRGGPAHVLELLLLVLLDRLAVVVEVGVAGAHDDVEPGCGEHIVGDLLVVVALGVVGPAQACRGRVAPLDTRDHAHGLGAALGDLGQGAAGQCLVGVAPVDRVVVGLHARGQRRGRGRGIGRTRREELVAGKGAHALDLHRRRVPRLLRLIDQICYLGSLARRLLRERQGVRGAGVFDPHRPVIDLGALPAGRIPLALVHAGGTPGAEARAVSHHDDHIIRGPGWPAVRPEGGGQGKKNDHPPLQRRQRTLAHAIAPLGCNSWLHGS